MPTLISLGYADVILTPNLGFLRVSEVLSINLLVPEIACIKLISGVFRRYEIVSLLQMIENNLYALVLGRFYKD